MSHGNLLTVNDLAERWQVSPETVRRYARTGELQSVRMLVRGFRFTEAQAEAFARNHIRDERQAS